MNIKPLADRVLILPAPAEEKTIGGIIIPDTAKEKPLKGEVVATGNGTKDEEMILKVGDTVLYGKYAGTELEFEGVKYLMMRQSDVLAVVYYNFIAECGFFINLGIQGGYAPPILSLTAAPDYEGGLKVRRLSPYQSKAGNVWFLGRIGRNFGKWEVALSLRYALLSPFGEAFPYPMLTAEQESAYRDVRSRHLAAGVSVGYRLEW